MGFRALDFLETGVTFFGADLPFQVAQRFFIASEMRLRPAALMPRRFLLGAGAGCFAFGGRPRRGEEEGEPSRSSAEIAWSNRLRSVLSSESKCWISTNVLSSDVVATDCNRGSYSTFEVFRVTPSGTAARRSPAMRTDPEVRLEVEAPDQRDCSEWL